MSKKHQYKLPGNLIPYCAKHGEYHTLTGEVHT